MPESRKKGFVMKTASTTGRRRGNHREQDNLDATGDSFVVPPPGPSNRRRQQNTQPAVDSTMTSDAVSMMMMSQMTQNSTAGILSETAGNIQLSVTKEQVLKSLQRAFNDAQESCLSHSRIIKQFKKDYYAERRSSAVALAHQKLYLRSLWKLTIVVLAGEKGGDGCTDRVVKLIQRLCNEVGTPEDREAHQFPFSGAPLYMMMLKLLLMENVQCDHRNSFRQRVMELFYAILKVHGHDALLQTHRNVPCSLIKAFNIKLREKVPTIRGLAALNLQFFDKVDVVKDLKYFGRSDTSPDVRKMCVIAIKEMKTPASKFFYEMCFDPVPKVRVEAFKALATKPMGSLSTQKQEKVLYWGLNQGETNVRDLVIKELLPKWLEECQNQPITLLKKLNTYSTQKVAAAVLNALYPGDSEETFGTIDLSFLNEQNLVPIEQLDYEKVFFWHFLLRKFRNRPYCCSRLTPQSSLLPDYIRSIITGIHQENIAALNESRDEDAQLVLCLSEVLRIVQLLSFEEGTRRTMESLLRTLLLDPVLDEIPLISAAVYALHKVSEPELYENTMMGIVQDIFEPRDPSIHGDGDDNTLVNGNNSFHDEDQEMNGRAEGNGMDFNSNNAVIRFPQPSASPSQQGPSSMPATQLSEHEVMETIQRYRREMGEAAMDRLRLFTAKNIAVANKDYLKAHALQEDVKKAISAEKETKRKLFKFAIEHGRDPSEFFGLGAENLPRDSNGHYCMPEEWLEEGTIDAVSTEENTPASAGVNVGPSSNASGATTASSSVPIPSRIASTGGDPTKTLLNAVAALAASERANDEEMGQNQILSQPFDPNSVVISEQGLLKGLIMMTHFLLIQKKITPAVRMLYENHILQCLTDTDSQVRSYTLYLLAMFGVLEKEECRRIMALILRAIEADIVPRVRVSAMKSMVDLILCYPFDEFKPKSEEQVYAGMNEIFNDFNATDESYERFFCDVLDSFCFAGPGVQAPDLVAMKVQAYAKLLLQDRFVSEGIISELFCLWLSPSSGGLSICYHIGQWLPLYVNKSLECANKVANALFKSVKKIINSRDGRDHNGEELPKLDETKLIDFVCPFISPPNLQSFFDGSSVHENLAISVIKEMLKSPNWGYNAHLGKFLSKLVICHEDKATEFCNTANFFLLKLAAQPQSATIGALKRSLKNMINRLTTQFDIELEAIESNGGDANERSKNATHRGAFSDSDIDVTMEEHELVLPEQVDNSSAD